MRPNDEARKKFPGDFNLIVVEQNAKFLLAEPNVEVQYLLIQCLPLAPVPDGINSAILVGGPSSITQTLGASLEPFARYSLNYSLGHRLIGNTTSYRAQLLAGNTVIAEDDAGVLPANGQWISQSLNFSTSINPIGLNQPLGIRFSSYGTSDQSGFTQVTLDAVGLTATHIPTTHVLSIGIEDDGASLGSVNAGYDLRGDFGAQQISDAMKPFANGFIKTLTLNTNTQQSGNVAKIDAAVAEMRTHIHSGDQLLVYINGHGGFDNTTPGHQDEFEVNAQYLSKQPDVRIKTKGDEYVFLSRGDSNDQLYDDHLADLFRGADWDQVQKLFAIDTCYSGGFKRSATGTTDSGDLSTLKQAGLLSATSEENFSYNWYDIGQPGSPIWGVMGQAMRDVLNQMAASGNTVIDLNSFAQRAKTRADEYGFTEAFVSGFPQDNWTDLVPTSFDFETFATDDFSFEISVPEPSDLILALTALCFFHVRRRNKNAA